MKEFKPLRLMAADHGDLSVISACLQDAVAKLGDIAFLAGERRFAFVANRFVWETAADRKIGPFTRVRVGVHFDDVKAVKYQNVRQDAKDAIIEILSIQFEPAEDGAGDILITLAGGGAICLEVEAINAYLSDISEPWQTRSKPSHEGG